MCGRDGFISAHAPYSNSGEEMNLYVGLYIVVAVGWVPMLMGEVRRGAVGWRGIPLTCLLIAGNVVMAIFMWEKK
jgi:drug/metabolite transporter superfamily protein YnfA